MRQLELALAKHGANGTLTACQTVTIPSNMLGWARTALGTLLVLVLVAAGCSASAASVKRVLILDRFERDVAPFGSVAAAFRTALALELGEPVEFHEVALDLAHGDGAEEEVPLLALLESQIKARLIDLVVPVGAMSERIAESRLPSGGVIRFHQAGFWERYRLLIVGATGFSLLQTALIAGLVVNRARRRRGEAEAILIADISSKFVNFPPGEVDSEIMDAQRRICELVGLDVSTLWQWEFQDLNSFTLTHFYRPPNGPPTPERMAASDHFPWCQRQLLANRTITVCSLDELPAEAARDHETWHHYQVKSALVIPLSVGAGPPVGAMSFNTMRKERNWPDVLVKQLQQIAVIFANALERKRADQVLRESREALCASEARLAAGVDLAGLGYYEFDFGEQTSFFDGRAIDICGIPPDQQQNLQALDFWMNHLHPGDRQWVLDKRRELHDGMFDQVSIDYRYLHPTDGQKWIHHLVRVATHDATGRAVRSFGVVRDITPRKRASLEVEELRANLTHLTRVSTLGALSGSLAHELNQPLGIILSNAQAALKLLRREPPDVTEATQILADIVAADRRAGEVIDRLRTMLKRGEVALQPLPLNQVIEDVLLLARADLIGHGVTVDCDLAADLPSVAGDHVQLQQLVLNLILNAVDAMAANGPDSRRIFLQTTLHQHQVRATVRDEGSGIPADAEFLFQPFYSTKPQGLGLGLGICRSIMAAHHGRLWAEPHPERGAVFHFELPAAGPPSHP